MAFPWALLQAVAGARPGKDRAALRFESMAPASPQLARYWRGLLAATEREMRAEDSVFGHPLVVEQATRMVAAAALTVFPNTTMSPYYVSRPARAAPAVVRRAMEYIDAHAHEPMAVTQIAAAAGIGVRGLQHAFVRHLGTTPLGYARRMRLEGAHRELQGADPGDGARVQAIAARWGFANPGRFAGLYSETFGVLPSHTLNG